MELSVTQASTNGYIRYKSCDEPEWRRWPGVTPAQNALFSLAVHIEMQVKCAVAGLPGPGGPNSSWDRCGQKLRYAKEAECCWFWINQTNNGNNAILFQSQAYTFACKADM